MRRFGSFARTRISRHLATDCFATFAQFSPFFPIIATRFRKVSFVLGVLFDFGEFFAFRQKTVFTGVCAGNDGTRKNGKLPTP